MVARIEMSHYSSKDRQVSVTHASLRISAVGSGESALPGDCFDPRACCDEQERRLIEELRAYLRPQSAPACLIERLQRMFDTLVEAPEEDGELDRTAQRSV
ncbi:hypothetical protein BACT_0890 [Bifidobacterium actinocoloniiforme DSM 22766]|uniref:Uncharacterized protein n=1 Tax=Bifidobacterium actinocoloniiforme DSM 22766 TaxID=1437605 RepID=A0A086Z0Y8_9BIFI|nr:hypothetical protein [Bifidobacterium actinocoloniiforme]AKV55372.1 hypothetical protein AB656_03050 [Bifidobacterium actinocoloniiforme DSM 22766]KFI40188.1 hypothetical protein BACT_0890 [Bifidobacterium actinocoloniiforme DSM 22766]